MPISPDETGPYIAELDRMYTDALYTAQSQFEAYKRHTRYARSLVFLPSLIAATSGFLVAVGLPKWLGALGAVAGVMAATASYLGADRRPTAYLQSAREFTVLRHDIRQTRDLAAQSPSLEELIAAVKKLALGYREAVRSAEATNDRDFIRASKRIKAGSFDYLPNASNPPAGGRTGG